MLRGRLTGASVPTKLALRTVLLALLLLIPSAIPSGAEPAARNVRGIHTLAASRQAIDDQLSWAAALIGANGHVTQPFLGIGAETTGPTADAVYFVEQAHARELDPILVLQGRFVNRDGCNTSGYVGWLSPTPDAEGGTYRAEAEGYRRFVAGLPRAEGRTLYLQIGNEPNLNEMWGGASDPAAYARFFVEVSAAIRSLGDPKIKILNAALAPEGNVDNLQFIAEALQAEPDFATAFDYWATHPYPRNRPPTSNLHDGTAGPDARYTIDSYLLELGVLAEHGVDTSSLEVILTETGYELGDAHHPEFPAISEELRAEYVRQAFQDHWPRWPEVKAVTPFELSGWYGSWRTFDWVWPSSSTTGHGLPTRPRLQYARLVPGLGIVGGTAVDDRGTPLASVTIRAEPGGFLAETLADGTFLLLARPGVYTLTAGKDGFGPAVVGEVQVAEDERQTVGFVLPARLPDALRGSGFEQDSLEGWTAWGDVDGPQDGPWFFDISSLDGGRFLGTAVNCGSKDGGVQQTVSSHPGRSMTVTAWTLTFRQGETRIGNRLGVDPWGGTDPRSATIVWTPLVDTGGLWQPVCLSVQAQSDRITVFLEHDQDAANAWNISAFDGVELVQAP